MWLITARMSVLIWCTTTGWIPQKQKSRSSPALHGADNRWSYCGRQKYSVDVCFTPASWTVLWLSLDGDSSSQFRIVLRPRTRTADISSDFEVEFSYLQFSCLLNSTTNENECGVTCKMFPWTPSLTNRTSLSAISCPCTVSVHVGQFHRTDTMQDWRHVHNKWTKSILLSLWKCMCYVAGPGEGGISRIIDKWLGRFWRWADSYKVFLEMGNLYEYYFISMLYVCM